MTTDVPTLDTSRPFTTAQARAAGISAGRLRGPGFRRLHKGVYVAAGAPEPELLGVRAALLLHGPDAFASHHSAAKVYRVPVPDHPDEHVSVTTADGRRRRGGIRCHLAPPEARVVTVRGIRVETPDRMLVGLAGYLSLVDLVVAGDHIVRKEWYTPAQLVAACERSTERHAVAAARAARYVRAGVDSPMETRLRLLIVLAGLPEPQVNFLLRDDLGDPVRRFDLCYPELKLIVEYDGRQHAESTAQYDWDIERREDLDKDGWRLLVVTAKGIYRQPERTLRRVRDALAERGARDLPRRLDDGWRKHFPAR